MKTRTIEVQSQSSGEKARAVLMVCEDCEGDAFNVYFIQGGKGIAYHPHLQCTGCGSTFCQGNCPPGGFPP